MSPEDHKYAQLEKRESMRHNGEKQISVDPISLRSAPSSADQEKYRHYPLTPPKTKFLSCSVPNSASSSPRCFGRTKSPSSSISKIACHSSSVALTNLERLRESHLRRSKSCGEGRSYQPSIDFDIHSTKIEKHNRSTVPEEIINSDAGLVRGGKEKEEEFKCGALCLFLPGFGKGKASVIRARKDEGDGDVAITGQRHIIDISAASHRASLEKFECGSWRSSTVLDEDSHGGGGANQGLFFDLPLELIRCSSVNDTESPVTAGFVFENREHDREQGHRLRSLKGVLKHSSTSGSSGCNSSSRHVRFSVSSPTSPSTYNGVTPRFDKARDEFSAFLEAQNS